MAAILVVEDEPAVRDLIELYLRRDGHEVQSVANGLDALRRLEREASAVDLVVLDLMLPGLDGRGVCRRIRDISTVPVIMVTALDDPRDKLGGFGLGADDYVTKPFDPEELMARIRAVLRRTRAPAPVADHLGSGLVIGNLIVDEGAFLATVGGRDLDLRTKELQLLAMLARNAGQVVPREVLIDRIWVALDDDSRTLDVHISRLREKLARQGASVSIDTVRSIGYRLSPLR
jgi:DNA-binding response OmpR family regulator